MGERGARNFLCTGCGYAFSGGGPGQRDARDGTYRKPLVCPLRYPQAGAGYQQGASTYPQVIHKACGRLTRSRRWLALPWFFRTRVPSPRRRSRRVRFRRDRGHPAPDRTPAGALRSGRRLLRRQRRPGRRARLRRGRGRRLRAHPAAGRGGRAERARRHAAVQGRHRRRHRRRQGPGLLPAHARAGLRRDPRPLRPRRARRRGHRRQRADQAQRAGPDRRAGVPAHADGVGAHGGQRRVLRRDRARARDPAAAGGRRNADHADGLRDRRRRHRRDRQQGAVGDLQRHGAAGRGGLRAAGRHHGGRARRDRVDLQPLAAR